MTRALLMVALAIGGCRQPEEECRTVRVREPLRCIAADRCPFRAHDGHWYEAEHPVRRGDRQRVCSRR